MKKILQGDRNTRKTIDNVYFNGIILRNTKIIYKYKLFHVHFAIFSNYPFIKFKSALDESMKLLNIDTLFYFILNTKKLFHFFCFSDTYPGLWSVYNFTVNGGSRYTPMVSTQLFSMYDIFFYE